MGTLWQHKDALKGRNEMSSLMGTGFKVGFTMAKTSQWLTFCIHFFRVIFKGLASVIRSSEKKVFSWFFSAFAFRSNAGFVWFLFLLWLWQEKQKKLK